jgi:hypothetical protein
MYSFPLSNGVPWYLEAGDPDAESAVDGAAAVMRLPRISSRGGHRDPSRRVQVFSAPPEAPPEGIFCVLPRPNIYGNTTFNQYTTIAHALARGFAREGGVLLHGALAEYRPDDSTGQGVIFSAHGGAGKTTASRRLPVPWRSLSDDAVLVMPSGSGRFRAHPWPTWSSFLHEDRSGNGWDVQTSVPLHACFFLRQAGQDSIVSLGPGQAAGLLAESARQINFQDIKLPPEERRMLRLQRFDAICSLAKNAPAYLLQISLEGEFWRDVERVLR